ncbi:MAG: hypothetical protein GY697_25505 [Desulfobacterales bacterium]|nr:hypothetical protein [Desulfobacterales bacterium]
MNWRRPLSRSAALAFTPLDSPGKMESGADQGHAPDAVFIDYQDSSRTIQVYTKKPNQVPFWFPAAGDDFQERSKNRM